MYEHAKPWVSKIQMLDGMDGHIDWTVVASTSAETLRIWEWPDVIGEPIDPAREGREAGWLEAA